MVKETNVQAVLRRQQIVLPLPKSEVEAVVRECGHVVDDRSDRMFTYVTNIKYHDAVYLAVKLGATQARQLCLNERTGELFTYSTSFFNASMREVGTYSQIEDLLTLSSREYGVGILEHYKLVDTGLMLEVLERVNNEKEASEPVMSGHSMVNSFTLEGEPRIANLVEEYMRQPSSLDEMFTLDSITPEQGNDMKDSKDRLVDGDGRELKADPNDPPVRVSLQVYETLVVNTPNGPDIPVGGQILHQRVFETEELKHKYQRTAENFADAVAEKSLGTERIVMISDGLHTQVMTFQDAQRKWRDEYFPNPGSRGGFNWGKAPINEPNRVMEESTNDYLRTADLAAAEKRIVEAAMESVEEINNELSSGQEAMSSRAALEQFEELLRQPASPAVDSNNEPKAGTPVNKLPEGARPLWMQCDSVVMKQSEVDLASFELRMMAAAGANPEEDKSTPVFASEPTGRWSGKTPVVQELKHKWKVGIVVHLPVECIDIDTIIIWLDESMVERLLWEELVACAGTTASVKLNYVGSDEADSLVLLTSNSGLRDAICVDAEDVVGVESLNSPAVRVYLRQSLCYVIKR